MNKPIKVITLIRPWGHAIAYLGKDIENRTWRCTLNRGDYLAIHNGNKWDQNAVRQIQSIHNDAPFSLTKQDDPSGQIIAVCQFEGNVTASTSPWFFGPIGWKLSNVVPIEGIPAKGRLGLWIPDDDTMEQLRANYRKALSSNPN